MKRFWQISLVLGIISGVVLAEPKPSPKSSTEPSFSGVIFGSQSNYEQSTSGNYEPKPTAPIEERIAQDILAKLKKSSSAPITVNQTYQRTMWEDALPSNKSDSSTGNWSQKVTETVKIEPISNVEAGGSQLAGLLSELFKNKTYELPLENSSPIDLTDDRRQKIVQQLDKEVPKQMNIARNSLVADLGFSSPQGSSEKGINKLRKALAPPESTPAKPPATTIKPKREPPVKPNSHGNGQLQPLLEYLRKIGLGPKRDARPKTATEFDPIVVESNGMSLESLAAMAHQLEQPLQQRRNATQQQASPKPTSPHEAKGKQGQSPQKKQQQPFQPTSPRTSTAKRG